MPESLSRVPLSLEEEHTVGSMARWMRFMAVVGICGGFAMLFFLVLGTALYTSVHAFSRIGPTSDARWAKIAAFIASNGAIPFLFAGAVLLVVLVTLWQNMILFHAGDDFHLVATTDAADLDYLAKGLDRLRLFFKIQVLAVVAALSLTLLTGLVAAAIMRFA
jgi:hypothetical protein